MRVLVPQYHVTHLLYLVTGDSSIGWPSGDWSSRTPCSSNIRARTYSSIDAGTIYPEASYTYFITSLTFHFETCSPLSCKSCLDLPTRSIALVVLAGSYLLAKEHVIELYERSKKKPCCMPSSI
jgi:hypothetical protein